jgi:hypothetical protein
MRRLIYQVAVGEVPGFYETCMASVAAYAERLGIDHRIQREPILRIAPLKSARSENALRLGYLPIYEKENAFRYLQHYDQIAIIDADIYIRPGAPNLFDELKSTFAAVVERDLPATPVYADKVRKHSEGQFRPLTDVEWDWNERGAHYFNMGMMLFDRSLLPFLRDQTPTEFLRRPEFERFVNGESHWRWSTDQSLLNYWLKRDQVPTQNLDWRWNAMYRAVQSVKGAYFIHFYLAGNMAQRGAEIPGLLANL